MRCIAYLGGFILLNVASASYAQPVATDKCGQLASRFATERAKLTLTDLAILKKCVEDQLRKVTSPDPSAIPGVLAIGTAGLGALFSPKGTRGSSYLLLTAFSVLGGATGYLTGLSREPVVGASPAHACRRARAVRSKPEFRTAAGDCAHGLPDDSQSPNRHPVGFR
jgi:hypothetical protein